MAGLRALSGGWETCMTSSAQAAQTAQAAITAAAQAELPATDQVAYEELIEQSAKLDDQAKKLAADLEDCSLQIAASMRMIKQADTSIIGLLHTAAQSHVKGNRIAAAAESATHAQTQKRLAEAISAYDTIKLKLRAVQQEHDELWQDSTCRRADTNPELQDHSDDDDDDDDGTYEYHLASVQSLNARAIKGQLKALDRPEDAVVDADDLRGQGAVGTASYNDAALKLLRRRLARALTADHVARCPATGEDANIDEDQSDDEAPQDGDGAEADSEHDEAEQEHESSDEGAEDQPAGDQDRDSSGSDTDDSY